MVGMIGIEWDRSENFVMHEHFLSCFIPITTVLTGIITRAALASSSGLVLAVVHIYSYRFSVPQGHFRDPYPFFKALL